MMTFYTALKLMQKFNLTDETILCVSREASRVNGTSADLREGDHLSLKQLFYGLMLPSGNDAAYCIAEHFGELLYNLPSNQNTGSMSSAFSFKFQSSVIKYFLKEMNVNAKKLRMFSSQFDSPHGLMNKHNYSCAQDVALMIEACMQIPYFRKVVNTQVHETHAIKSTKKEKLTKYRWENTNKLLGRVSECIGCKTGITKAAGPCFAGYFEKGEE